MRRLSDLRGGKVYNDKDVRLGKIRGFAVDAAHGRIAYAVLSFGGVLGIGDKEFAVPWSAIKKNMSPTDHSKVTYVINVDKSRLENVPGFDKDHWPAMADVKWGRETHAFWGQRPYWEDEDRSGVSVNVDKHGVNVDVGHKEHPTVQGTPISPEGGKEAGGPSPVLVQADELVGHDIVDRNGKEYAELTEVMVDPQSGRLVYGIVQIDKWPDFATDYKYPAPWKLVQVQPKATDNSGRVLQDDDNFTVVLDVPRDKLKSGPRFPEREWPNMTASWGEQVYKYYGLQPFWEKMEKR